MNWKEQEVWVAVAGIRLIIALPIHYILYNIFRIIIITYLFHKLNCLKDLNGEEYILSIAKSERNPKQTLCNLFIVNPETN